MIVVQLIRTRWTKISRGEPGASKRNASPTALLVPATSLKGEAVVHDVRLDEREDFSPSFKCTAVTFEQAKELVRPIEVRDEGQTLRVRFIWNFTVGAPERSHGRAIRLHRGEWCQILSNGRYGYDDEWAYGSIVVNIAWHPDSLSAFEDIEPVERDDHRANLW